MAALIQGPLAEALTAGRERYNAQFAQARRASPQLDPVTFGEFLSGAVRPLVDRVDAVAPAATRAVVDALYELALEIVSRDLPGRCPSFLPRWRGLLERLPEALAEAPRLMAGSVANALFNLESTPGARPQEWVESMRRLAAVEQRAALLLEAGKVAAWRAGMAQYREGALATCGGLPPDLARRALGLPETDTPGPLEPVLERLAADPWLHPAQAELGHLPRRALGLMRQVGAFRGFGGTFLTPPRLTLDEGQFFAWDDESCWVLHADLFGATLHRVGSAPQRPDVPRTGAFNLDGTGLVRCGPYARLFPELREARSFASDGVTLAATVPLSHAIHLVALVPEASR